MSAGRGIAVTWSSASAGPLIFTSTAPADLDRTTTKWLLVPAASQASAGPSATTRVRPRAGELPVLERRPHVDRAIARFTRADPPGTGRARSRRARPTTGGRDRRTSTRSPARGSRSPAVRTATRAGNQLRPELVDAPAEEQVSRPPVAVAPEQVGRVVILDHQPVALGLRQERADAIVEVRPREAVQVLGQVGQGLVEPAFFLGPASGRARRRAATSG